MAAPTVRISPAADVVSRRFSLYGTQLRTWRSLWVKLERALHLEQVRWFETEGAGSWKALSEDYAKRKAKLYPGRTILVAEGDLRDAATHGEALKAGDVFVWQIDDPKAEWHQIGAGRLPVRKPMISITKQRALMKPLLQEHIAYHGRRGG